MHHTLRLVNGHAPLRAPATERVGVLCVSATKVAMRYGRPSSIRHRLGRRELCGRGTSGGRSSRRSATCRPDASTAQGRRHTLGMDLRHHRARPAPSWLTASSSQNVAAQNDGLAVLFASEHCRHAPPERGCSAAGCSAQTVLDNEARCAAPRGQLPVGLTRAPTFRASAPVERLRWWKYGSQTGMLGLFTVAGAA